MDPDDIYFPEAEDIGPHAIAFAHLMFAHSEFEREVRSLQGAITNDLNFGERRGNHWKARQRPERMAKLIKRGRLTLNVLLSFAQFEREVTSERIRDKIAASKRK